ncbi:PREDICTED: 14.7 kDa heat shock protein [Camelina sativa]|uniref:14.7 kDa heat shock protein n=1 Tax=Camelina sativa TaxID=90675 RepID=A0ABM0WU31_CAMSA|nr:PREDICTED: 14.7 kDa heat shock protein [Camelina sativa]
MSGSSSRAATSAASDGNYKLKIEEYGGGKGPVRWTFKEDSCIARVDIPGCKVYPPDSTYEYTQTHFGFSIPEEAMDQNDHSGRKYFGFVKFDPEIYDVVNAKIKFRNGVLWVTAPKYHQG